MERPAKRRRYSPAASDDDIYDSESSDGVGATYESDPGEDFDAQGPSHNQQELRQIPFGTLVQAQKALKGKKKGNKDDDDKVEQFLAKEQAATKRKGRDFGGKANKNAPTVMSAKKPVSRRRDIVETHDKAKLARDPRFDPLSGNFKKDLFQKSYGFLADQRAQEIEELEKAIAKAEKNRKFDPDELESMKRTLTKRKSQKAEQDKRAREAEALQKWKQAEKEKQSQGKKAWFLKPSAKKDVVLKAQFEQLSGDHGKLRKVMEKKQRKVDQKDKKLLPARRK